MSDLTWVEINKKSLVNNINVINKKTDAEIMYVLKANAYGHGLAEITQILVEQNIQYIAIQSIYEAPIVRSSGFKGRIILLGPFEELDVVDIIKYDLEVTVFEIKKIEMLDKYAQKEKKNISIHLKIETGLHRQGLATADIEEFCNIFMKIKNLIFDSISTHFANIEDINDYEFSKKQFEILKQSQIDIQNIIGQNIKIHAANSGALLMYPEFHGDMVRVGIILYGLFPSSEIAEFAGKNRIELKPVLSWKTKIMNIHNMNQGETLGYGCTFTAKTKTKIALLPLGYYDGYYRSMRNGHVIIAYRKCSILGTICMNMMMVDTSELDNIKIGDKVILIGKGINAEKLAEDANTINYEIVTSINSRIPRIII